MIRNSDASWGSGAKLFHWVSAVIILFSLVFGWWMTHMAQRSGRLLLYEFHGVVGYYLLLIILMRLLWRMTNRVPAEPADTPAWQRVAASAGHWLLYAVTLASVIFGWLLAGTFKQPLTASLFGSIQVPLVIIRDRALHDFYEGAHMVLSYVLLALVVIHVGAALHHHYWKKNDVLRRMWWSRSI